MRLSTGISTIVLNACDFIFRPIVFLFSPQNQIRVITKKAALHYPGVDVIIDGASGDDRSDYFPYLFDMLEKVHGRAGALVSHLSIMLALSLYMIKDSSGFAKLLITIDTVVYLVLVIMLVRCLKVLAIDQRVTAIEDKKTFENLFFDELAYKFAILQTTSAAAIIATLVLLVSFVVNRAL